VEIGGIGGDPACEEALHQGEFETAEQGMVLVDPIAQPLQEEQPKDELFVVAPAHVPAQDVAGFEKKRLKVEEGELGGGHTVSSYSILAGACRGVRKSHHNGFLLGA
jgi:hypothetical protein